MTRLDPEIAAIVEAIHGSGAAEYCDMTPAEARASHNEKAPVLAAPRVELASVRDAVVPADAAHPEIPVRVYRPSEAAAATLVFYHGGGHVIGSLDSYDTLCRQLAAQSGLDVVSVDYRLAPENPFPAAVDDACRALDWLARDGAELSLATEVVCVGGDSAGGNLAAVAAIHARDTGLALRHQLLVYPATAAYPDTPSQLEFGEGHVLTRRLILWFHRQYLRYEDHTDVRWAPLLTPDLAALAPATIILAGCDPLRDEGIDYATRLAEDGNDVVLRVFAGAVHPFFSWSGASALAREAVSFAATRLREAAARTPAEGAPATPSNRGA